MIHIKRVELKKREHWCFFTTNNNITFKGKKWVAIPHTIPSLTRRKMKMDGMTFSLMPGAYNDINIYANDASAYNHKYIQSFEHSLNHSFSKRKRMCDDCVFKHQYTISRQCNHIYKKSILLDKPEK